MTTRDQSTIERDLFIIAAILVLCLISAVDSDGQGITMSAPDTLTIDLYTEHCIHGPWAFAIPSANGSIGWFTGDQSAMVCVWTAATNRVYMGQIITGDDYQDGEGLICIRFVIDASAHSTPNTILPSVLTVASASAPCAIA
jgi:hypothetical protein